MSIIDINALRCLWSDARTYSTWQTSEISDELLHQLYELMKWGPTSANSSPLRIIFVKSKAEKDRLIPCMAAGNQEKTRLAPVTAILGMDMAFYEHLPRLFPHNPNMRTTFDGQPEKTYETALRNSSLQGGYFILAARALGLDCGPMSGFNPDAINKTFFNNTTIKANFICNLGYGDPSGLHPRGPRLDFDEACQII